MNDEIKQGLESLDGKSIEELDSLTASCFTEFDATDSADEKQELLAAARKFTERKKALVASGSGGNDNGDGGSDGGGDPPTGGSDDSGDGNEGDGPDSNPGDGSTPSDAGESAPQTETPAETAEATTASGESETAEAAAEPVTAEATTASGETEAATATDEPETAEATTASGEPETAEATAEPEAVSDPAAADPDGSTTEPTATSEEPTVPTTTEEAPVTASGTGDETAIEVAADNQPLTASTVQAPTAVVAGMDVQGISAGSEFKTAYDVGHAFSQRIRTVGRSAGNDGEKHTVATITASYPENRVLDGNAQGNADKINAVLNDQAVVASGGFCAPLPVHYDIFGIGVTNRPVRDSLMMFNANRGGVRFVTPPVLSDLEDAVGLWTSTTDAEPGTAVKAELKVTCAAEQDAEIDAVTLQLEFGNFMTRAYPELVNRNNELGMIQHARFAEQELLSKMADLSTEVTAASKLGIGIDFLNAIARAGSAYRNRNRMPRNTPLRVIAPDFVLDAMRTDLSQRVSGDNVIALADAAINQFLMAQNVRVTWHLDGAFAAQSDSSPLVEYPTSFEWHLFAEGSFLFLDGGTLDIGVVRDSTLVGTNDYKTFFETFEGVAMVGVEALVVTQELAIEGATVGTIAPSGS